MDVLSKYQNRPVNINFGKAKLAILGLILLIIIGVMVGSAVSIVDAGFRGVLLHWNAVDLVDPTTRGRTAFYSSIPRFSCST